MNEIVFNNQGLPVMNGCNLCVAADPFLHADRVLPFHVLLYVLEGAIYVTEDGTDYTVGTGELLFLKKDIRHFGKVEIPKGTRWYYVHFYFEEQENLSVFVPDSNPVVQGERLQTSVLLPKKMSCPEKNTIERTFGKLVEYFHSEDEQKRWYLNIKLAGLLSEIAFYGMKNGGKQSLADQIAIYLSRHMAEPFSAKKLEKQFFLSYKHMAAVFKKDKGLTMQQYHTNLRMQEACKLLQSTLIPVGEISERLGYTDMLYFSRCFHQFAGMSPTAYRKKAPEDY
ncbi:MAG: AraC family transcriptional regulator [Lachnospiraceae bacterium]|nr:AraC family transcriptional regulator [Lachnospiraceae bacterium]